jgi:hypothetical protein
VGLLGFFFFFVGWIGCFCVFGVFGFSRCFLLFFCILLGLCPFVYLQYAWGAYNFYKTSLILPIKKQTFNGFKSLFFNFEQDSSLFFSTFSRSQVTFFQLSAGFKSLYLTIKSQLPLIIKPYI